MKRDKHPIKIFISHSHKDQHIAKYLIDYLRAEFALEKKDIRCTSVPGYMIPAGEIIVQRLREDADKGLGFIAILSHHGLASQWVTYELGAAWVKKRIVIPILGPDIKASDKRVGLINYMNLFEIDKKDFRESLSQFVDQIGDEINLSPKRNEASKRKLQKFINSYREHGGENANFSKSNVKISSPKNKEKIDQNIQVKFTVKNLPKNGFLWIGIKIGELFYPKKALNSIIEKKQDDVKFLEGGDTKPGKEICILGVGSAGNDVIEIEMEREKTQHDWSGIKISKIPGAEELYCVKDLTILNKL